MKNKPFLCLVLFLTFLLPVQSQEDVNLFDFWKFYTDSENVMYKSSCNLAFKQLREREASIAQLQTKGDYLARQ